MNGKAARLTAVVAVLAMVAGCASTGNPKVAEFNPATQIEYGKTTKAEIKAILGEPKAIRYGADGKEVWAYVYAQSQVKPATFVPVVGWFAGGLDGTGRKLIFVFDDKGVVQKEGSGEAQIQSGSKRQMQKFVNEEKHQ